MAAPLASTSTFREDIAGAIVTGGTSTAYTVASYRKYASLAELDGNIIAFTPHATNGQTVTLNVDGLGAKPLRLGPGVELQSNVLIQGTPYTALYNHASQVFYLHALGGNAYGVPLAAGMDYWGPTTPSSAFAFPAGQQISRVTYARLFALIGTQYGGGDGSTTFNLPDKRGRVSAGLDPGNATGLLNTMSATLGAMGGEQTHTLTAGEIPPIAARNPSQAIGVSTGGPVVPGTDAGTPWFNLGAPATGSFTSVYRNGVSPGLYQISSMSGINDISVISTNTGGGAHNNVQPTIVCNYIMRVL
ncbi:tail fiber protein [Bradyrhizobium liaoningense]|nr:tail fiber protein [Bradyrhizobium liaoningense]